jgi:hypothetical protein
MWMRPEYVGLLGRRAGVPFLYRWDARTFATQVQRSGTDYVVDSFLLKTDLTGSEGNPHPDISSYAQPAFEVLEGVFTLKQVDRAALDGYLSRVR